MTSDGTSDLVAAAEVYFESPTDEAWTRLFRAAVGPLGITRAEVAKEVKALTNLMRSIEKGEVDDRDAVLGELAWLDLQLQPTGRERGGQDQDRAGGQDLDPSLYPVDLEPVLSGCSLQPVPDQLHRDDGEALLYAGAVNGIHGDSGTGKGWIVCHLMRQNAQRGVRTMLLDFEDTAHSITARLRLLGMSDHDITTWIVYLRPQVPFFAIAVEHFVQTIDQHNIGAVIVDSVGEAFGLAGVNEDKDNEVGPWLRMVARPLADTGASLTLVDHSTKAGANDLHPSGSKRKRAAITGASYLVEAIKPFVKGEGGRVRLTCAKDRHGNYRRGQAVGDLVMDSNDLGVRLKLYAPTITTAEGDATVPIILAARKAVAAAKDAGRPLSRNELEARMAIKGRAQIKRAGIDHAAAEGALGEERGPRNSRLFTYRNDLEETT